MSKVLEQKLQSETHHLVGKSLSNLLSFRYSSCRQLGMTTLDLSSQFYLDLLFNTYSSVQGYFLPSFLIFFCINFASS